MADTVQELTWLGSQDVHSWGGLTNAEIATEPPLDDSIQIKPFATTLGAGSMEKFTPAAAAAIAAVRARSAVVAARYSFEYRRRQLADEALAIERYPGAADAARRQAAAEGLTLQLSENSVGYRGVYSVYRSRKNNPFKARVRRDGKQVSLGYYATAEEAALAYARTPEAQEEVLSAKPPPLNSDEAAAQARIEGLTLERSGSASGYKGVRVDKRGDMRCPFEARLKRAGKDMYLGHFATAEEAALAYARTPEAQAELAKNMYPLRATPITAQEVEGLTLGQSENESGYQGVRIVRSFQGSSKRPFHMRATHAGQKVHLGSYATPEEAVLAVARDGAAGVPGAAALSPAAKRVTPDWMRRQASGGFGVVAGVTAVQPPAKQPRLAKHIPLMAPLQATVLWCQPWSGTADPSIQFSSARPWPADPNSPPSLCPPLPAATTPEYEAAGPLVGSSAHNSFEALLDLIKWELNIAAATPADATIAQANALMGFASPSGTLRQQLNRLVAETTCTHL